MEFAEWATALGLLLVLDLLLSLRLAQRIRQPLGHLGTSSVAYCHLLLRFHAPLLVPAGEETGLGVLYNSLFVDPKGRSVAPRALVRRTCAKWDDLFCGDYLRREVAGQLHWRLSDRYVAGGETMYTVQTGLAKWRRRAPCDIGSWASKWQSQHVLVAVSRGDAPRVPGMNWGLFGKLRILGWDYDFMRKVLWHKLTVSSWFLAMTRDPLCSFHGVDETQDHVFGGCKFGLLVHEAVLHPFRRLGDPRGVSIHFSTRFLMNQGVAVSPIEGILTGCGMSAAWSQRCKCVQGKGTVYLHTLVDHWTSKLAFWVHSSNFSMQRAAVSPLLHNLRSWLEFGILGSIGMFPRAHALCFV